MDADATPPEPATDARILPVRTEFGKRHREFTAACRSFEVVEMSDWPVDGPRAAKWVMDFLARVASGGPEAYHRWWRSVARLTPIDWGVSEHGQICRYLQLAASYDQVDCANLAILEAITRRLQLIEYQYRERSREGARGGAQGGAASGTLTGLAVMAGDEADLFDGVGRLDGVVCVAPELITWISAELKRTADIDKAARKAREEKALARGSADLVAPPLLVDLPKAPNGPGRKNK